MITAGGKPRGGPSAVPNTSVQVSFLSPPVGSHSKHETPRIVSVPSALFAYPKGTWMFSAPSRVQAGKARRDAVIDRSLVDRMCPPW